MAAASSDEKAKMYSHWGEIPDVTESHSGGNTAIAENSNQDGKAKMYSLWGEISDVTKSLSGGNSSTADNADQGKGQVADQGSKDKQCGSIPSVAGKHDKIETNVEMTPDEVLIKRIVNSDARIKNQQRGDPDLTIEEKEAIVTDLLRKKPNIFLERFGNFMEREDMIVFEHLKNDYEIKFYLKEIKKHLDSKKNKTKVRNRRFEAMTKLMDDGKYFSEESMRERDPLMYEHYIGQYLTKEETEAREKKIDQSDMKFSTILMDFMDRKAIEEHLKFQKWEEDDMLEEEDESEDSEEEDSEDSEADDQEMKEPSPKKHESGDESEEGKADSNHQPTPATAEEKEMLRHEFMRNMQLRFLEGKDTDFNYATVDENVEYDSLDIREHDEEEEYFDDEEPITVASSDEDSTQMNQVSYRHGKDSDVDYDEMDFEENDVTGETDR